MVETISHSEFNFSSDYIPSYSFASTMRTCYANNSQTPSMNSGSSESSSSSAASSTNTSNSPNLKASNLESRRSSCNETYLRNLDPHHHHCNNKRCSNTITTTCVHSNAKTKNKPKLQLTTTTFEDGENNLLSSCTTQLCTPQSNGVISQQHQFSLDNGNSHLGQQPSSRTSTSGVKQRRSESFGLYRQCSELNDTSNLLSSSSFDDAHENSNSSEDDLVFVAELSSSPTQHHMHQVKGARQLGNGTLVLCKLCGSNSSLSNASLTSFSSMSSSVSSAGSNLNQFTLTNNSQPNASLGTPDNMINNLSHSLNQTFNFTNNSLTPQFGRSRHNSINSLTLGNNGQPDRNLHALHKALHNIFSN